MNSKEKSFLKSHEKNHRTVFAYRSYEELKKSREKKHFIRKVILFIISPIILFLGTYTIFLFTFS